MTGSHAKMTPHVTDDRFAVQDGMCCKSPLMAISRLSGQPALQNAWTYDMMNNLCSHVCKEKNYLIINLLFHILLLHLFFVNLYILK